MDHILAINKDGIEICQGNFTVWQENKERKDAYEADEQERLKKRDWKAYKGRREEQQDGRIRLKKVRSGMVRVIADISVIRRRG